MQQAGLRFDPFINEMLVSERPRCIEWVSRRAHNAAAVIVVTPEMAGSSSQRPLAASVRPARAAVYINTRE